MTVRGVTDESEPMLVIEVESIRGVVSLRIVSSPNPRIGIRPRPRIQRLPYAKI